MSNWHPAAAGYHINPGGSVVTPFYDNISFPLYGPDEGGFELMQTDFLPAWFTQPEDDVDFVNASFYTPDILGVDLINSRNSIVQGFLDYGEGTPLAFRLWHKTEFSLQVPETYTLPSFLPFGLAGTHDVPFGLAGQNVVSLEKWYFQLIYHNIIPFVIALAIAVLAVIGGVVLFDELTHGRYHLTDSLKTFVHGIEPGTITSGLSKNLILGMGLVVVLAIAVPQLTTSFGLKAGPLTTEVGQTGQRRR